VERSVGGATSEGPDTADSADDTDDTDDIDNGDATVTTAHEDRGRTADDATV
jgi:hypothetical protein